MSAKITSTTVTVLPGAHLKPFRQLFCMHPLILVSDDNETWFYLELIRDQSHPGQYKSPPEIDLPRFVSAVFPHVTILDLDEAGILKYHPPV